MTTTSTMSPSIERRLIPLFPPSRFGWVVAGGLLLILLAAAMAMHYQLQPGGLERAIRDQGTWGRNSLTRLLAQLSLTGIALPLFYLPRMLHTLVLSGDGITLERSGRTVWTIPWSGFTGWQPEVTFNRRVRGDMALWLCEEGGPGHRLVLGDGPRRELLAGLAAWCSERGELPPRNNTPKAWHFIGQVMLAGAAMCLLAAAVYPTRGYSPIPPATIGMLVGAFGIAALERGRHPR